MRVSLPSIPFPREETAQGKVKNLVQIPRELLSPELWHVVPFIISLYSPRVIKLESGGPMRFPRFPRHV